MAARNRAIPRGIALFAALALMAVIALLVAGAAASARLAQRSSRFATTDASLTRAADYALATVLADSRRVALADLPFGTLVSFAIPIPSDVGGGVAVAVTRLPHGLLWIVADASGGDSDHGHRRVNIVARFPSLGSRPEAAIVARGDVELGANVVLSADSVGDPDCATMSGGVVAVAPGSTVTGADSATIASSAIAVDSASYFLTARQLSALRDGGRLVHVLGDTTIGGGSVDGILIVEGSLTIAGPFSGTGLIVARGPIDATSGAFSMVGAVMSFAPKTFGAPAIKFSGVTIRYSLCAVDRALRRALIPRPVVHRSWAELF